MPDAVTYITYIAGLCRSGTIEDAFWQLEIMVAKGLQLTVVGPNILLDYAAKDLDTSKKKDLDTWVAKEVLERCEELGFEVDAVTYNTDGHGSFNFSKKMKWLRVHQAVDGSAQ